MGPAQSTIATAILDSGMAGHFLHPSSPAHNIVPASIPLHVRLPDGSTIASTHTATLTIPGLPRDAAQAHIYPDLHAGALLSVSQLCDTGCTVTFMAQHAQVHQHNCLLLQGKRAASGLWHVPLPKQDAHDAGNKVIPAPIAAAFTALPVATQANLSAFLHAACFSPAISLSGGDTGGILNHMAWADRSTCGTTPATVHHNHQRAPTAAAKEHPVHQTCRRHGTGREP